MRNYGYHARWEGDLRRKACRALVQRRVHPPRSVPLDAYSYSGESMVPNAAAFYLRDCLNCSIDKRIPRGPEEGSNPFNCGLLLLFRPLDWPLGIGRLLELKRVADFFTAQTIVQEVMHANGAFPFDERKFVLQLDDQFTYSDRYAVAYLVLRHYMNPIRHKFWNAVSPR